MALVVAKLGENPVQPATAHLRSVWEFMVAAEVVVLFITGCPSAILRAIVSVVINAVDTVLRAWASPHVLKECLVGLPPFTDADSPCSVVLKHAVRWVGATRLHVPPCSILGSLFPVGTFAVFSRVNSSFDSKFATKAPTRFGSTAHKEFASDYFGCSAITSAYPSGVTLARGISLNNSESPESLVDKIVGFHRVEVTL
jgi:hypothetical protein